MQISSATSAIIRYYGFANNSRDFIEYFIYGRIVSSTNLSLKYLKREAGRAGKEKPRAQESPGAGSFGRVRPEPEPDQPSAETFFVTSTSTLTASTDLSKLAFSSADRSISMIFSTPLEPMMVGTPI